MDSFTCCTICEGTKLTVDGAERTPEPTTGTTVWERGHYEQVRPRPSEHVDNRYGHIWSKRSTKWQTDKKKLKLMNEKSRRVSSCGMIIFGLGKPHWPSNSDQWPIGNKGNQRSGKVKMECFRCRRNKSIRGRKINEIKDRGATRSSSAPEINLCIETRFSLTNKKHFDWSEVAWFAVAYLSRTASKLDQNHWTHST